MRAAKFILFVLSFALGILAGISLGAAPAHAQESSGSSCDSALNDSLAALESGDVPLDDASAVAALFNGDTHFCAADDAEIVGAPAACQSMLARLHEITAMGSQIRAFIEILATVLELIDMQIDQLRGSIKPLGQIEDECETIHGTFARVFDTAQYEECVEDGLRRSASASSNVNHLLLTRIIIVDRLTRLIEQYDLLYQEYGRLTAQYAACVWSARMQGSLDNRMSHPEILLPAAPPPLSSEMRARLAALVANPALEDAAQHQLPPQMPPSEEQNRTVPPIASAPPAEDASRQAAERFDLAPY